MDRKRDNERYSHEEAQQRFRATLRSAFNVPTATEPGKLSGKSGRSVRKTISKAKPGR